MIMVMMMMMIIIRGFSKSCGIDVHRVEKSNN